MSHKAPTDDLAVQATNDDATLSKRHAVEKGYWKDDFVKLFCRSSDRKSPEINQGYYARVKAYHIMVDEFLKLAGERSQIVNFGAGFDTLYWLLHSKSTLPKLYVEVDFSNITAKKCNYISTKKPLFSALQDPVMSKDSIRSKHYHLVAGDLRNMAAIGETLLETGIDTSLPTMFLTECVLVYMEPEKSQAVINWAGRRFKTALFLNYDPINPHDRFGKTMQSNLMQRHCSLLGIDACPSLATQKERYLASGWAHAWALDMAEVYKLLPKHDVRRIERIEFLDEKELLIQLLQHYCLSCGFSDELHLGLENVCLGKTSPRL